MNHDPWLQIYKLIIDILLYLEIYNAYNIRVFTNTIPMKQSQPSYKNT